MIARLVSPSLLAALLGLAGAAAFAATPPTPVAATPAPGAATTPPVNPESGALVETAPAAPGKDAKVEHLVSEDSQVRIDETRVRGVTTKIVVHSKVSGGSYEIQPADHGVAPEHDYGAGMRKWTWGF